MEFGEESYTSRRAPNRNFSLLPAMIVSVWVGDYEFNVSRLAVLGYAVSALHLFSGLVNKSHRLSAPQLGPPPPAGPIGTAPAGGGLGPKPSRLSDIAFQEHWQLLGFCCPQARQP